MTHNLDSLKRKGVPIKIPETNTPNAARNSLVSNQVTYSKKNKKSSITSGPYDRHNDLKSNSNQFKSNHSTPHKSAHSTPWKIKDLQSSNLGGTSVEAKASSGLLSSGLLENGLKKLSSKQSTTNIYAKSLNSTLSNQKTTSQYFNPHGQMSDHHQSNISPSKNRGNSNVIEHISSDDELTSTFMTAHQTKPNKPTTRQPRPKKTVIQQTTGLNPVTGDRFFAKTANEKNSDVGKGLLLDRDFTKVENYKDKRNRGNTKHNDVKGQFKDPDKSNSKPIMVYVIDKLWENRKAVDDTELTMEVRESSIDICRSGLVFIVIEKGPYRTARISKSNEVFVNFIPWTTGIENYLLKLHDSTKIETIKVALERVGLSVSYMNSEDTIQALEIATQTLPVRSSTRIAKQPQLNFQGKRKVYDEIDMLISDTEQETDSKRKSRRIAKEMPTTNRSLFQYPFNDRLSITIREQDFHRLNEGEFLNDTVIEFYIRTLKDKLDFDRVHFFSSFFYNQLILKDEFRGDKSQYEYGYEKVKKWTNKVDIFQKDYLVLPINEHLHWYLVIIYNPSAILQSDDGSDSESESTGSDLEIELSSSTVPPAQVIPDQEPCGFFLETQVPSEQVSTTNVVHISDEEPIHDIPEQESQAVVNMDWETISVNSNDKPESISTVDEEAVAMPLADHELPSIHAFTGKSKKQPSIFSKLKLTKSDREHQRDQKLKAELKKCKILVFDSLGLQRSRTLKTLKHYLVAEAITKKQTDPNLRDSMVKEIGGIHVKAPIQPNHCDCGVYLLEIIQRFFTNPQPTLQSILARESLIDWFSHDVVVQKRIDMMKMMRDLQGQYQQLGFVVEAPIPDDTDDEVEIIS